ncbi:helix-turn-helix domain-containing protein [Pseudomonas lactucae]|uniref:helix-turn-helix domain-containing protein n=1 Tax=Pseudomonas lactucae TaxID=2813360 RepID=UPI0038CD27E6
MRGLSPQRRPHNPRGIGLNQLVIFHKLLLGRSVSLAADKLSMTPPAVSNAMKRLRTAFRADLLARRTAKPLCRTEPRANSSWSRTAGCCAEW